MTDATEVIIGLDLSLACTGLAGRGWCERLESGPSADSITARVGRMVGLRRMIAQLTRTATAIVVEGPAYQMQHRPGGHQLAGFWWLVISDLVLAGKRLAIVQPSALKRYATGKGSASKGDVRDAVARRYPEWEPRDDNEADALVLCAMGYDLVGQPLAKVPATHREALSSVRWEANA